MQNNYYKKYKQHKKNYQLSFPISLSFVSPITILFSIIFIMLLNACSQQPKENTSQTNNPDAKLNLNYYKENIAKLASDEFEGRAPNTPGGKKTVAFLEEKLTQLGLEKFKGDYKHPVSLISITLDNEQSYFAIDAKNLEYRKDTVYWTKRNNETVEVKDSPLVFVGYGIVAPEYGWNDYKNLDVKGKTVVMLINDPGFVTKDISLFKGNTMTYYGRWTYKFEEAARQGATAAILIHETAPAAYPWSVVEGSWSGPQLDMVSSDKGSSNVAIEAWITHDYAEQLFSKYNLNLREIEKQSLTKDFLPIAIGNARVSIKSVNNISIDNSNNVIGYIKGDTKPNEYILYTAHWDHLGIDPNIEAKDRIYNGAVDNATGSSALLTIAQNFLAKGKTQRSIIFAFLTAEESGLLGSKTMAANLPVNAAQIVGGINIDAILPTPKPNDLTVVGYNSSEMEDLLSFVANKKNIHLTPDQSPEKGYFYRSDHVEFAKIGIPMLYTDPGTNIIGLTKEESKKIFSNYTKNNYHKPSDEYSQDWDLSGTEVFLEILSELGFELANSDTWPNWYEDNEFRLIRDKSLKNYNN